MKEYMIFINIKFKSRQNDMIYYLVIHMEMVKLLKSWTDQNLVASGMREGDVVATQGASNVLPSGY